MTISYRAEVTQSWVGNAPRVRDLAALLEMSQPLTMRGIIDRLRFVETAVAEMPINTDDDAPINGHVKFVVKSNGSYVFSGHMRATGALSYHYGLQCWVKSTEGLAIAAHRTGDVYGTDTSGDRQDNWSESGTNNGIKQHWRAIRGHPGIGYHLNADMSGVLGTVVDVLKVVLEGLAAEAVLGPGGLLLVVGSELSAPLAGSDALGGAFASGTGLMILGPIGAIPALIAGGVEGLAGIRHRVMTAEERAFANRVFNGTIDYDRILLTNMSHDGRKFTFPTFTKTILVNMNDALDNPMGYTSPGEYEQPGSVFIHELTHAWQICNNSLFNVICGMSESYDYAGDTNWSSRDWNSFNNEQQAHIVDDWYGRHVMRNPPATGPYLLDAQGIPVTDLDGFDALNDKAYRFITENILTGQP